MKNNVLDEEKTMNNFVERILRGRLMGLLTMKPKHRHRYTKVNVWAEEISGIIYYLDTDGNVYDPQDIFQNIVNPKIISQYKKEEDTYIII